MFEAQRPKTRTRTAVGMLELIYHSVVRDIRKGHRNAVVGLLLAIMQSVIFVGVFYFMFSVLGLKGNAIRGDFVLFLMSGILLFLAHNKAMSSVMSAEGPASAMMNHAPMNTVISIVSSALSTLYIQLLSMATILTLYYILFAQYTIYRPVGALGMTLMAWFSGVAVGIIFLALKPWAPGLVALLSSIYMRANMITSGKMFVANTLPSYLLAMFDWNPLFHAIDQARGYTFINYNPHFSSVTYPLKISLALIMIGLMLEFYTRKRVSASWDATR